MPARDPAASPQVLAQISSSYTSSGLASRQNQQQHLPQPGLLSPTSSNFSRTTSVDYGSLSQSPTMASRFLRRVSGDRGRPSLSHGPGHGAAGMGGSEPAIPQAAGAPLPPGASGSRSRSGSADLEAGTSGLQMRRLSDVGHGRWPTGFANMAMRNASQDEHRSTSPKSGFQPFHPSTSIRDSSNRLASFATRPRGNSITSSPSIDGVGHPSLSPHSSRAGTGASSSSIAGPGMSGFSLGHASMNDGYRPTHHSHLNQEVSSSSIPEERSPPTLDVPVSTSHVGRSGLSILVEQEREKSRARQANTGVGSSTSSSPSMGGGTTPRGAMSRIPSSSDEDLMRTPMPRTSSLNPTDSSASSDTDQTPTGRKSPLPTMVEDIVDGADDEQQRSSALRRYLADEVNREDIERGRPDDRPTENTPLLAGGGPGQGRSGTEPGWPSKLGDQVRGLAHSTKHLTAGDVVRGVIVEPVKTLPSVILGLLLNVLDGVSYGMIMFPANPAFDGFGSLGVSMFFVSCIMSQLVFSLGGSIFPGGNGSMMIECVPFFHILVNLIQERLGDDIAAIQATTLAAFAFSAILTGLVFFALGAFRLGVLVGYFPRHILVGCIGGVGIFLIETGLEVSLGLKEDGFQYNLPTLKLFFESPHAILLWTIPLALAILLRVITHFFHHQLIFPAYFFFIPLVFYVTVFIGGWAWQDLRNWGWVLDVGESKQAWWKFYTYYSFKKTDWGAFWAAMPTQLALVFFGILHVPLNVPALGVTLREDNVKLDRELIAHGFSNFAAGLAGTVPNYLTYVNTVLFYRVGGGSRLSGLMLSAGTIAIMMVGPSVIGYLPVVVVGALIFVLGIDLTIEAVWDTRHRVNRSEYITIWAIAIGMTLWDFVIGLLFGIILACIFFVVQNSRRKAIRAVFSGATAKSTVRRPRSQREFIQQVGSQTYVMKLQGFLFFGTITTVEAEIRKLLDMAIWQHSPIRFLILDLTLVHGLDFSSAEAFVRVQRLLAAKDVSMIICGAAPQGPCGPALQAVGLWADQQGSSVEVFAGLNDALEWTENAYLTAFYENQKSEEAESCRIGIDFPKVENAPFSLATSFENSPRRTHLARAGGDTLPRAPFLTLYPEEDEAQSEPELVAPAPLLMQTLGGYMDSPTPAFFAKLAPYFTCLPIVPNQVLWTQDERPDGLYVIESGSLRATYVYGEGRKLVQETMVAGTIAGDLSALSDTKRNATVVAERDGTVWKIDMEGLRRMEREQPDTARDFFQVVLRAVAEEQDVLSSHLIAVLS